MDRIGISARSTGSLQIIPSEKLPASIAVFVYVYGCVRGNSTILHIFKNCYFFYKKVVTLLYLWLAVALATWYNLYRIFC